MRKYIDAEQLEDVVTDLNSKGWGITRNDFKLIDRVLFEFPAADVVEVKHGRWVGIDDYPHETWECDQCGCIYEEMTSWVPNYCPNCGASMDEVEDE